MNTAGQDGELRFVAFGREVLKEAPAGEGIPGLLRDELAPADLAIFDTPLDLVIGFETHRRANGLRESHAVFLVDDGRTHVGIIPQERPCFKRFLQDRSAGLGDIGCCMFGPDWNDSAQRRTPFFRPRSA